MHTHDRRSLIILRNENQQPKITKITCSVETKINWKRLLLLKRRRREREGERGREREREGEREKQKRNIYRNWQCKLHTLALFFCCFSFYIHLCYTLNFNPMLFSNTEKTLNNLFSKHLKIQAYLYKTTSKCTQCKAGETVLYVLCQIKA